MPLRIEDVVPAKSLDYFIGSVHWLDALTPPLEAHLQRLAADVRTLLARAAAPADLNPAQILPPPGSSRPLPPEPPAAARANATASRPKGAYAVIAGLTAIVLALGFFMVRSRSQNRIEHRGCGRTARPQSAAKPGAGVPAPASAALGPVSAAVVKKVSAAIPPATPAQPSLPDLAKPVQPAKPSAAKPAPAGDHDREVAREPAHDASRDAARKLVFNQATGATIKIEQLIGDEDKERHQPTRNQTGAKFGVEGAALGYSFEHDGHAYFLFGDVVGRVSRGFDTMATSDATDPESGVPLDFLTTGRGRFWPWSQLASTWDSTRGQWPASA